MENNKMSKENQIFFFLNSILLSTLFFLYQISTLFCYTNNDSDKELNDKMIERGLNLNRQQQKLMSNLIGSMIY